MKDSIEVRLIRETSEIMNSELLALAERALGVPVVSQLVASVNGVEAGFLSLDHRPELSCAVPYEIFVLAEWRKLGIGSALLAAAEALGSSCGHRICRVSPRGEPDLVVWYEKRGYVLATDSTGEYEKALPSTAFESSIECESCSRNAYETMVKVIDILVTGKPIARAQLVSAGLEIMGLRPQDITAHFRSELIQLQHLLTWLPGPRCRVVKSVEAMTRDDELRAAALIGVLGIVTGALPIDRQYLDS